MNTFPITYRKAHDNSWIQCFRCGQMSHNRKDAEQLFCGKCCMGHANGIIEPAQTINTAAKPEDRQTKIIVALFLFLGKALSKLPLKDRDICVKESEIRAAWKAQSSPVRLLSGQNGYFDATGELTYRCVMGQLDLKKTGMDFSRKMPSEPERVDPLKPGKRVFDLE
jgi:hypothetical protein